MKKEVTEVTAKQFKVCQKFEFCFFKRNENGKFFIKPALLKDALLLNQILEMDEEQLNQFLKLKLT